MTARALVLLGAVAASTAASTAHAQAVSDVAVPTLVIEEGDQASAMADEALDLANIVQSAAKGVTTVQEAPAIVTVVTPDEIRDRQFQDITQIFETVPGWQRVGLYHSTFHLPIVRGQVQAVQYLHDGVSLFDPFINVAATTRVMPTELIKRVEMITGPGGVLWGSNSLLGILNVITKDAEDVDGVELGAELGDGRGDRSMARAYVMAGRPDLLGGKLKAFAHASVETYTGPQLRLPILLFHGALPQPNSASLYGPLTDTDQARSLIVSLNAKLTYEKFQLRISLPFGRKYNPAGLSGNPAQTGTSAVDACPPGTARCNDPRANRDDVFDRYAVAEYRTRFADDKAGVTARGYLIQFVRGFQPLQVLSPSPLLQGGLAFQADLTSYRAGGAFDGDVELGRKLHVLYGAEAFHEFKPERAPGNALQGAGTLSEIPAPYDLTRLPLLCPRIFDPSTMALRPIAGCPQVFAFPADRTVLGAYVDPQLRPNKRLIFDVGARLQVAPSSLGKISYPLNTTVAATAVWNFIPNWHLKLNFAQGFRPPVINNTTSNGEGVQIGGNPSLEVETSDATQAEVNARIFKGERRIRELSFRVDASYTRINNLIQVTSGTYQNSGDRGIASFEFLGKLYVQGGHRLELGYTYLQADTSDKGRIRSLPEHAFDLATVFSLVPNRLTATTDFRVTGAAEDPNRLVEYRGATAATPVTVAATDLVLDRIPPVAELSAGVSYTPMAGLQVSATVYNALVGHSYEPDVFFDYEPHLEYLPNPREGFRAYLSALYQY